MDNTLRYYETHAHEVSRRYEAAQPEAAQALLSAVFSANARVLELGCGSGRDGAYIMGRGVNWWGLDGAAAMMRHAVALHPSLRGRIVHSDLRQPLPFCASSFDGVFSLAALMHLDADRVTRTLAEAHRVLMHGGRLVLSAPIGRPDVDANGFDADGRYFLPWSGDEWRQAIEAASFTIEEHSQSCDSLGRSITWLNMVARKARNSSS